MQRSLSPRVLILAVLPVLVVLAGCGSSKSTPSSATNSTTSTPSLPSGLQTTPTTPTVTLTPTTKSSTTPSSNTTSTSNPTGGAGLPGGSGSGGSGGSGSGSGGSGSGGSTNARVPATFTVAPGGQLSPPTVSAPAFLAVRLTIVSHDSRSHRVLVRTPSPHSLTVSAHGQASVLIPGLRAGRYPLEIDGVAHGALSIGGEPGP